MSRYPRVHDSSSSSSTSSGIVVFGLVIGALLLVPLLVVCNNGGGGEEPLIFENDTEPTAVADELLAPDAPADAQSAAAAAQAASDVYIVQDGDTLWDIANRFDVTVEELTAINQIGDPEQLRVGQELMIPRELGGVGGN